MRFLRALEIWGTVAWAQFALRFWPERELASALRDDGPADATASQALVDEFRRTTRSIAKGRCLLLAVACTRFLRRHGFPASLRIGFTPEFHGHAWVDCESQYASRFSVFNLSAAGLAAWIAIRRTI